MKVKPFSNECSKEYKKLIDINTAIMSGSAGTVRSIGSGCGDYVEFIDLFRGKPHTYRVYSNGDVLRKPYNVKDSEFKFIHPRWTKLYTYKEVSIGCVSVKLHNLVHACFDPAFQSWFKRGKHCVVNHTVVTYNKCIGNLVPREELLASLEYTEVVTLSQNVKHGKFVNSLGLTDIYVSAFDVEDLLILFKNHAKEIGVSTIYDIPDDEKYNIIINYYNKERLVRNVPKKIDFRD